MVVNSILPSLLNIAQIVSLFNVTSSSDLVDYDLHPSHNYTLSPPPTFVPDQSCTIDNVAQQSQLVVKTVLNENYDKHLAPDPNGVTVSIELALQTFYDISETSASFTADVLMR